MLCARLLLRELDLHIEVHTECPAQQGEAVGFIVKSPGFEDEKHVCYQSLGLCLLFPLSTSASADCIWKLPSCIVHQLAIK